MKLANCRICGVQPKLMGGYLTTRDSIGYFYQCPKCNCTIQGKSVPTDAWGITEPKRTQEEINKIHENCKTKAMLNWNAAMTGVEIDTAFAVINSFKEMEFIKDVFIDEIDLVLDLAKIGLNELDND